MTQTESRKEARAEPRSDVATTRIAQNLEDVRRRVAVAAEAARRDPAEVAIVAVSKTIGLERVRQAFLAGQTLFGENRVQEALRKARDWVATWPGESPSWHMIGHLQSNKAREAVATFDLIHSVDSAALAATLDRHARASGRIVPMLLEVRLSDEPTKHGFAPTALDEAVRALEGLGGVRIEGLMTIAPLDAPGQAARPYFRRLREIRDELAAAFPRLSWRHLSMGMTDDFEVAVEEGATLVRVGRAIFGERR